jgi:hypothetical protein
LEKEGILVLRLVMGRPEKLVFFPKWMAINGIKACSSDKKIAANRLICGYLSISGG